MGFENFGGKEKEKKSEKETKKSGLKSVMKMLVLGTMLSLPMKGKAEDFGDIQPPEADKVSLELKKIDPENLEVGTDMVREMIEKEMANQGYSEKEIEEVVKSPNQEKGEIL